MIPYQNEKIKNAALFFAGEHKKRTRRPLYQTYLYKYLAFLDFISLRETGRLSLGLSYRAMEHGPVPVEVYDGKEAVTGCRFVKNGMGEVVIANTKPNLDYFSEVEIEIMNRLINFYAQVWVTAGTMSNATHEDIRAWKRTARNVMIDPALEFEGDVYEKKESELSFPEEVYLNYKAISC